MSVIFYRGQTHGRGGRGRGAIEKAAGPFDAVFTPTPDYGVYMHSRIRLMDFKLDRGIWRDLLEAVTQSKIEMEAACTVCISCLASSVVVRSLIW